MNSISQVINDASVSAYTGSPTTRESVRAQIVERFGKKAAMEYDPYTNCFTFAKWSSMGYRIKPGEKALRSVTYIEMKDEKGEVIKKIPRTVYLFYFLQVNGPRFVQP
ncbi:MAG TPA: hypothetical protein DEF00_05120 [Candidatus Taylorbacteria bacterium]|uniref:Uncharacterized protein n=1 Tax=Candidatus Magasanikbacteria bacterium GW2011_GWA2_42_32 TaxID=1619039 RepID=A0A0G1A5Q1_9BACT|nr:MAG: hypothetical protein UV20_C0014G0007 [Candidatus Magasanikbacteria bacterium GW2011_GWA2_42_32]KKU97220.1 MAG: hypothetical protein UY29_C0001G0014 [Parcubacteria group bacterium GW2011_GWC2_48_17]HBV01728.1 hypothetical protein [Candidatus Taylorbacteria bacterium]